MARPTPVPSLRVTRDRHPISLEETQMNPFASMLVTRDIEGEGRRRVDAEVRAMYRDPTPCRSRRSRSALA